ncbi:hypothetical protein phytr_3280 [Candidatus Phycorickettsia trachydisci]|uniref:Uncharacterized protein n=1 Tax=Candidatus Phycorickettsia trachydisci TaxID=2115978 RepID=A0A2P1P7P5_9RICK|nr:hypothetical protein [Candidatus Phycorickettsia trachydisci]AVP87282.1 hypothetical protein phytr_3280 [Candidatus Phycorickettsia trachydisci]
MADTPEQIAGKIFNFIEESFGTNNYKNIDENQTGIPKAYHHLIEQAVNNFAKSRPMAWSLGLKRYFDNDSKKIIQELTKNVQPIYQQKEAEREAEREAAAAATTIQRVFRGTKARAAIKAEKAKEAAAFESMNNMFERSELAAQRRAKKDNQKANDIRGEEALENLQHMFGVRQDERIEELTKQNLEKRSMKDRLGNLFKRNAPRQGQLGEIDRKKAQLKQEEREIKAREAAEKQFKQEEKKRPIQDAAQRKVTSLSEKLASQQEFRETRNSILKEKKEELQKATNKIKQTTQTLSNLEKERQALEKQKKQLESTIQQATAITNENLETLAQITKKSAAAKHDIKALSHLHTNVGGKLPELQHTLKNQTQEVREFEEELQNIQQSRKGPLTKREQIELRALEDSAGRFIRESKASQQKADAELRFQEGATGSVEQNIDAAKNRWKEANRNIPNFVANLEAGEKSHAKLQAELERIEKALKDNGQRKQASENSLHELQEESKALTKVVGSLEAEIRKQDLGIATTKAQQGVAIADQYTLAQMGISSDGVISKAKQNVAEGISKTRQGMSDLGSNMSAGATNLWNKLSPKDRQTVEQTREDVKKPSIAQRMKTGATSLAANLKKRTGWGRGE